MKRFFALVLLLAFSSATARADLFDFLKKKRTDGTTSSATDLAGLSQSQVTDALKQALSKGVQAAVTNLGKPNGFLNNPKVRIPMPERLQSVEKTLRAMKQDKYADDFIATMNRAAESAVPAALPIFTDALKSMSVEDAKKLVSGSDDSATQFFKNKGETQIQEKMLPIVKQATEKVGVTSSYKKLMETGGGAAQLLGRLNVDAASMDVDKYVLQKASDGLFKMIAEEEKRIRENPAARTTELLEKVFGAAKR